MTIIWTARLAKAVAALANDAIPHRYPEIRVTLDADVRARAYEYVRVKPGTEFDRAEVEYTHCLLKRLDLAWDNPRDTHVEFRAAWPELACASSRLRPRRRRRCARRHRSSQVARNQLYGNRHGNPLRYPSDLQGDSGRRRR